MTAAPHLQPPPICSSLITSLWLLIAWFYVPVPSYSMLILLIDMVILWLLGLPNGYYMITIWFLHVITIFFHQPVITILLPVTTILSLKEKQL